LLNSLPAPETPAMMILSYTANQLPGLTAALQEAVALPTAPNPLPPDAAARGAFQLAGHISSGEMNRGAHETVIPLFTRSQQAETRIQKIPGPILFSGY
jgi:hypothetical protein